MGYDVELEQEPKLIATAWVTKPTEVDGLSAEEVEHLWAVICYWSANSNAHDALTADIYFRFQEAIIASARGKFATGEAQELTAYSIDGIANYYRKPLQFAMAAHGKNPTPYTRSRVGYLRAAVRYADSLRTQLS